MKKVFYILLSIIILISLLYLGWQYSKSRTNQFFGEIINKVDTNDKVVALTFDDGPTKKTDEILKILDELDIKATFFVTGEELNKNISEGIKIVNNGHQLGNHSYSHPQMVFKSYNFIKDEIEKTDQLIRKAGYKGEILFRPPFCKKLIVLPYFLSKNNKKTITWNIEPETYPDISEKSENIVKYINENITPGSIILLHVMYDSREESLKSIKGIVNNLKAKGYSFKTVSELLN